MSPTRLRYRYIVVFVVLLAGAWSVPGAEAGAHAEVCGPGSQGLSCLLGSILPAPQPSEPCAMQPTAQASSPGAKSAAVRLEEEIENVPCVTTGRVSYGTTDDAGAEMDALDPIDDPAGGYLGVYHSPFGSVARPTVPNFMISMAYSADLIHWKRVEVLDPSGAAMATVRAIPGSPGYLLAYEKSQRQETRDFLRLRYYRSLDELVSNQVAAQVDLPRRFSPYSNGTPSFASINWRGSLKRSIIKLGFHYESSVDGWPGPDREALGTLRGFRQWTVRKDTSVDAELNQESFAGNHGDRRQFGFDGALWRVYEAQRTARDFSTWHVLLYDLSSRRMRSLKITLATGASYSSFGNPTAQVLRAPSGNGRVLAVTMFVFPPGSIRSTPGELVYYQPI